MLFKIILVSTALCAVHAGVGRLGLDLDDDIGLGGLGLGRLDGVARSGVGLGLGRLDDGIGLGRGAGVGWDDGKRVDYYARPRYEFDYGVSDGHTGDNKQQSEIRRDDVVKGEYSLNEPDGTVRIVRYEADDKNGFNARVIRKGVAVHPAVYGRNGGDIWDKRW